MPRFRDTLTDAADKVKGALKTPTAKRVEGLGARLESTNAHIGKVSRDLKAELDQLSSAMNADSRARAVELAAARKELADVRRGIAPLGGLPQQIAALQQALHAERTDNTPPSPSWKQRVQPIVQRVAATPPLRSPRNRWATAGVSLAALGLAYALSHLGGKGPHQQADMLAAANMPQTIQHHADLPACLMNMRHPRTTFGCMETTSGGFDEIPTAEALANTKGWEHFAYHPTTVDGNSLRGNLDTAFGGETLCKHHAGWLTDREPLGFASKFSCTPGHSVEVLGDGPSTTKLMYKVVSTPVVVIKNQTPPPGPVVVTSPTSPAPVVVTPPAAPAPVVVVAPAAPTITNVAIAPVRYDNEIACHNAIATPTQTGCLLEADGKLVHFDAAKVAGNPAAYLTAFTYRPDASAGTLLVGSPTYCLDLVGKAMTAVGKTADGLACTPQSIALTTADGKTTTLAMFRTPDKDTVKDVVMAPSAKDGRVAPVTHAQGVDVQVPNVVIAPPQIVVQQAEPNPYAGYAYTAPASGGSWNVTIDKSRGDTIVYGDGGRRHHGRKDYGSFGELLRDNGRRHHRRIEVTPLESPRGNRALEVIVPRGSGRAQAPNWRSNGGNDTRYSTGGSRGYGRGYGHGYSGEQERLIVTPPGQDRARIVSQPRYGANVTVQPSNRLDGVLGGSRRRHTSGTAMQRPAYRPPHTAQPRFNRPSARPMAAPRNIQRAAPAPRAAPSPRRGGGSDRSGRRR